jgi:hypothetical protein
MTRADVARAHRLGFRARGPSFELGLRFAVVGAAFAWLSARGASVAAAWATLLPRGVEEPSPELLSRGGVLLLQTLVGLSLLAGLGALASAWLTRNLGPRRRRTAPISQAPGWGRALIAFAVGGAAWVVFRGALAGAARGSASSLEGLTELWASWAVRTPLMLSALLLAAGSVEWLMARRRSREVYAQARERESKGAVAR